VTRPEGPRIDVFIGAVATASRPSSLALRWMQGVFCVSQKLTKTVGFVTIMNEASDVGVRNAIEGDYVSA
jgi:hypothetical protein